MADNDYDFSLPKTGEKAADNGKWKLICVLQLLTLVCVLLAFFGMRRSTTPSGGASAQDAEKLLELAQRLEKQGLAKEATEAWKEYLRATKPDAEKEAKLWYRIATIQQDGKLYEEALASFYRSDMTMKVPVLETEITRRTQECLAALGKAVAMKRNLEERTTAGAPAQAAAPLVSIGDWQLTREDIEAMAEKEIDMMIAASGIPEDKKLEQKQQMLKQLNQGEGLMQFAMQVVSREMIYRAALEEKLMDDPAVREDVMQRERTALIEAYMRRHLANIEVSDTDINDFYKAHPEQFTELAAVRLAHIEFADEESAKAAMKSLSEKQDFSELAKLVSKDNATASKGGEMNGWFTAASGVEWTREAARAFLADDKLAKGAILPTIVKDGKTWHIVKLLDRRAEQIRDIKDKQVFENARNMLLDRKSHEAQNRLMQELAMHYRVTWNIPRGNGGAQPAPQSQGNTPNGDAK
ncbi:MAG: peptidyl-prolyl cis-trans isomerase [Victivallales bacterium]|nr:peptidyl-prolyl cis-trans isomerase [Victivallales bacterium]